MIRFTSRSTTRQAILLILLSAGAAVASSAAATQTWRCGNTYTDQPCKGGRAVDSDDTRAPDQRREADAATREARAAAERLERDRIREEAVAAKTGRAVLIEDRTAQPIAPKVALNTPRKKKDRQEVGYFSARGPDATAKPKSGKRAKKA
jgi:hypothetical protein